MNNKPISKAFYWLLGEPFRVERVGCTAVGPKSPTPRARRSASAVVTAKREQEREEPQRALSQSGGGVVLLPTNTPKHRHRGV